MIVYLRIHLLFSLSLSLTLSHTHTHTHTIHTLSFTYYSQLQMFAMLMQQSPEVLMALGISPETIHNEISKQENLRKLHVR